MQSPLEDDRILIPGERIALEYLHRLIPNENVNFSSSSQRQLQVTLDVSLFSSIKESASLRDRGRLNTIAAQHAKAWLRAIEYQTKIWPRYAQQRVQCRITDLVWNTDFSLAS